MTGRAPYERDVNTVFQDYAIFPHMNVQQNVEYGLLVKKVGKATGESARNNRPNRPASPPWAIGNPMQLSGGQRQRVALCPRAG